jgi:hypothetical protein
MKSGLLSRVFFKRPLPEQMAFMIAASVVSDAAVFCFLHAFLFQQPTKRFSFYLYYDDSLFWLVGGVIFYRKMRGR